MGLRGSYILKGLGITLKHFVMTYTTNFKKLRSKSNGHNGRGRIEVNQTKANEGIFTVQYPEERLPQPERLRILPMLIYDEGDGNVRCTSCGICAKVCPPQCIWILQAKGPDGKVVPKPTDFWIDMDVCMNCGLCSEFCPFDAIKMDHNFELSNTERDKSHVYNMQDLLVSTEYYAKTHPKAWAQEEAARAAKKAKKGPAIA